MVAAITITALAFLVAAMMTQSGDENV